MNFTEDEKDTDFEVVSQELDSISFCGKYFVFQPHFDLLSISSSFLILNESMIMTFKSIVDPDDPEIEDILFDLQTDV